MAKIYRKSDRVKVQIKSGEDTITLHLSPLSQHEKSEVQSLMMKSMATKDPASASEGIRKSLQYSLKKVEGITDTNGEAYNLEFENGLIKQECIDDLMNMDIDLTSKVMLVCSNLVGGIPKEFKDDKGVKLPDIEILGEDTAKK